MGLKSKLLAPAFVIAAIVVAYSPLRAVAQETSGIIKLSDGVQVPEGLTTEISARASGGGARSGGGGGARSGGGGGGRSVGRSSGGSRSVGRSSGGGGKKVSSGKTGKHTSSKTGSGKTGSGKSAGSGKKTKTGSNKTGTGKTGTGKTGTSKTGTGKTGTGKIGSGPGKKGTGSKTGQGKNGPGKIGSGPGKKGTGSKVGKGGPGKVNKGPYVNINVNRGRNRFWRGNGWVTFVGFGTLAAILVGADYYDPYGYIAIARPYCEGLSDDGCQLRWQSVALEEGGEDWQCVQFCPRVRVGVTPVPVPVVAAPAVDLSAQAAGTCEVVIYAEPALAGTSTPTSENQPRLVDVGWKDEIASIEVKSGTWDFYTGDDYAGDTMRLAPGNYGQLAPDWTKHIGSFQCSNPG